MATNTLSNAITSALNEQMTREAHLSQIYLSYAVWADSEGLSGIANFLFGYGQNERDHMMRIIGYILKRGAKVHIADIPPLPANPISLNSCFEKVLAHESENLESISKLEKICLAENDWATWNFIQWFLIDMAEEERIVRGLLDKCRKAHEGVNNQILFSLS